MTSSRTRRRQSTTAGMRRVAIVRDPVHVSIELPGGQRCIGAVGLEIGELRESETRCSDFRRARPCPTTPKLADFQRLKWRKANCFRLAHCVLFEPGSVHPVARRCERKSSCSVMSRKRSAINATCSVIEDSQVRDQGWWHCGLFHRRFGELVYPRSVENITCPIAGSGLCWYCFFVMR
jgi:hypothetical protein